MQCSVNPLSHTMAADGYFMVALRAAESTTLTTTRYAYITGGLDIIQP
jgi:hypothetical protein